MVLIRIIGVVLMRNAWQSTFVHRLERTCIFLIGFMILEASQTVHAEYAIDFSPPPLDSVDIYYSVHHQKYNHQKYIKRVGHYTMSRVMVITTEPINYYPEFYSYFTRYPDFDNDFDFDLRTADDVGRDFEVGE
jgi:hypothetical protein